MTYYELSSIYGHDTFLLDVHNLGVAVKVRFITVVINAGLPPILIIYRATLSQTFKIKTFFFFLNNMVVLKMINVVWQEVNLIVVWFCVCV